MTVVDGLPHGWRPTLIRLKDAGYQYVNIDEGWWQGTRDAADNITMDTAEWPAG